MSWAKVLVWIPEGDTENSPGVNPVWDAGGTIEPEAWVRDHGVELYPNTIYFFEEEQ